MKLMVLQGLTRPACPVCPLPDALGGIWAGSSTWVTTAGWTHAWPGDEALLTWDGTAWTPMLAADAGWNVIPHAHRVYAADATHAWALTEGTIWGWDGTAWTHNTTGAPKFEEVPARNPCYYQIETMYNRGGISGYACGGPSEPCDAQHRPYFRWGSPLTRGQLAKILDLAQP